MSRLQRKPLISLCMIVRNEADTLARCLTSVHGIADELIIVDTGSTDATLAIARSFGARIVSYPWTGDFAAARNAGLEQARGTWILVLDADEELDAQSKGELLLCAEHTEYEAFFVRIHNHKGTAFSSPVITVNPILRMFRNRPQYRFSGIIHEQIAAAIVEATPAAAMHLSTVSVHHYGYADGVVAKKDKISRNLSLLKEQLRLNPRDAFHQFNTAVEYMRLGDYTQALEHIRLSLAEAEPDTSFIHLLYKYEVRCRIMSGDQPGALDACIRGCTLFPDYPDLHHIKGVLLLQAGAFAAARQAFRQALEIGVSPPGYHTESGLGTYLTYAALGQLCQETGEAGEAMACYTRAAQLHPAPAPLLVRLVRIMKCAGREHELPGWLKEHLPQLTADVPRLAGLLLAEGCLAAAAKVIGASTGAADVDIPDGGAETRNANTPRGESEVSDMRAPGGAGAADADLQDGGAETRNANTPRGDAEVTDICSPGGAGAAGAADAVMPGGGAETRLDGKLPAVYEAVPESASSVFPSDDAAADLLRLLQRVNAVPVDQLQHQDITLLLSHPAACVPEYGPSAAGPASRSSRAWLLLADRMLAALPAASGLGPAAARVRLTLPLPRTGE
ncbi:tetratricopeptide repeat-containing glycosyltransferase family 2 protein [Paenibacillus typhae]|uniref:Glycosyltransferase involved in cell wall bisynthesis n=1 Tax=Paenibacillus typhae TaxID=1174501 RepID=A0A1G9BIS0_9BACL|nr:glycosyltransferase family 2 protein [Paenibacillus typhae]SDK39396.1 Glycosyltransferase involved in cell wall bisynthesis [Paenibacillus typhae]